MKRPILHALFSLAAGVLLALAPSYLRAEDNQTSSFCPESGIAPEEFVKQAIVLCMQDLPSRRSECMRDAEIQFQRCQFRGNFRRISSRVQTRLIVLSLFKNLVSSQDRYRVASNGER